jgi:Fe-S-cluster-containing hydrogenase component 2
MNSNRKLEKEGYPAEEELKESPGYPPLKDLEQKPLAVIECIQEIPCNPCEEACPFGAIRIGSPITNLPILDTNKCTGCSKCIAACPGLAIFRIEIKGNDALISFPYEYLPLPQKGEIVICGDREGNFVSKGEVTKVTIAKNQDNTPIIEVNVKKEFYNRVRTIVRGEING